MLKQEVRDAVVFPSPLFEFCLSLEGRLDYRLTFKAKQQGTGHRLIVIAELFTI